MTAVVCMYHSGQRAAHYRSPVTGSTRCELRRSEIFASSWATGAALRWDKCHRLACSTDWLVLCAAGAVKIGWRWFSPPRVPVPAAAHTEISRRAGTGGGPSLSADSNLLGAYHPSVYSAERALPLLMPLQPGVARILCGAGISG